MRSQSLVDDLDPLKFIVKLNDAGIHYLLIGSIAAAMHDIPIGSADYDFWVKPAERDQVYSLTEGLGLSGRYQAKDDKPQDTFTDGEFIKLDFFFVKEFANRKKDIRISFNDAYPRSVLKSDRDGGFQVRIPSLEDLITMKVILSELRPDQIKQLEYLMAKSGKSL